MRADIERAMSPTSTENEQAIALEEALQQVTRMADLVDSLLTLARADEGRFDLFREPVQLDRWCARWWRPRDCLARMKS